MVQAKGEQVCDPKWREGSWRSSNASPRLVPSRLTPGGPTPPPHLVESEAVRVGPQSEFNKSSGDRGAQPGLKPTLLEALESICPDSSLTEHGTSSSGRDSLFILATTWVPPHYANSHIFSSVPLPATSGMGLCPQLPRRGATPRIWPIHPPTSWDCKMKSTRPNFSPGNSSPLPQ